VVDDRLLTVAEVADRLGVPRDVGVRRGAQQPNPPTNVPLLVLHRREHFAMAQRLCLPLPRSAPQEAVRNEQ
jgi:hypothetical protein